MSQNIKKKIIEFVPIWQYCKETGIQPQNIYRKIKLAQIDAKDFEFKEKIVRRLMIRRDLAITIRKRKD